MNGNACTSHAHEFQLNQVWCMQLTWLYLDGNDLTGSLPDSWGVLPVKTVAYCCACDSLHLPEETYEA